MADLREVQDRPYRYRHSEGVLDASRQSGGDQRVSPAIEEVVGHPERRTGCRSVAGIGYRAGQQISEQTDQSAFGAGARCSVLAPGPRRCGERGAVDLAVDAAGQFGQGQAHGRDHVGGQVGCQVLQDRAAVPAGFGGVGHQVRHQYFFVRRDDGRGDSGVGGQGRFDLPQLDPLAPDLYLEVVAPQELQLPVGADAGGVAGAVEPSATTGRVGDEAGGGQVRAAMISPRQLNATQIQLTRHTVGYTV